MAGFSNCGIPKSTGRIQFPIVHEVLEHDGEDELLRTQNEVKPFYLGTQEEQVVGTQNGSMERTGGSASQTMEPEELLAKVTEKMKQVVATVIEYKIAN